MQLTVHIFALLVLLILPQRAQSLTLAANGRPTTVVVLSDQSSQAELTAAQDLANYLGKITGGSFTIQPESALPKDSAGIFVGPTRAALKAGVDCSKLDSEEWIIRTSGKKLILAGGKPRGTMYATYHFLEDVLRVHWWNPWEESVPQSPSLAVGPLNLRGKPIFRYRDIYMLYGNDAGRFAAHNRLNREGDAVIDSLYGGSMSYGPPYHVHTFSLYFPPLEYFNKHPEWFSLINGRRVGINSQLCLTNPELRQAFLARLIDYVNDSHTKAKAVHMPPPMVFSVSQNDNENHCQCDKCQAITKAEGTEAGPLLDFVNFLADNVRKKYPGILIDTLAYQHTQKPPRTIKPHRNVIIRLCDSGSDMIRPITDPVNTEFRNILTSWARITNNLRVWTYAVTYTSPVGMPLPTIETIQTNYKFYISNNVQGVFTELEYPILADMRDFKAWLMIKLLENPHANMRKLEDTFLKGYYSSAAPMIRQYLADLNMEARTKGTHINPSISVNQLSYLNVGFVLRAQTLFDQAEQVVGNDSSLLRRIRHARLSLDRASVILFPKLKAEWVASGRNRYEFPLSREKIAARVIQTWSEQADLRLPVRERTEEKSRAMAEMKRYKSVPDL